MVRHPALYLFFAACGIYLAVTSIVDGKVELGGKSGPKFIYTYAADPGIYLFSLAIMFALAIGCAALAWRLWHEPG